MVLGIGDAEQAVKSAVTLTTHSRVKNFVLFPCLVVAKITNILPSKIIGENCMIPAKIELADKSFKHP